MTLAPAIVRVIRKTRITCRDCVGRPIKVMHAVHRVNACKKLSAVMTYVQVHAEHPLVKLSKWLRAWQCRLRASWHGWERHRWILQNWCGRWKKLLDLMVTVAMIWNGNPGSSKKGFDRKKWISNRCIVWREMGTVCYMLYFVRKTRNFPNPFWGVTERAHVSWKE